MEYLVNGVCALVAAWVALRSMGAKKIHWAARVLGVLALVLAVVGLVIVELFGWRGGVGAAVFTGVVCGVLAALVEWCGVLAIRRGWVSGEGRGKLNVLAGVAIFGVVVGVMLPSGSKVDGGGAIKEGRQEAAPVAQVKPGAVVDCLCSVGGECVGPYGGRYCTDDNGKKRYKKRESAGQ